MSGGLCRPNMILRGAVPNIVKETVTAESHIEAGDLMRVSLIARRCYAIDN